MSPIPRLRAWFALLATLLSLSLPLPAENFTVDPAFQRPSFFSDPAVATRVRADGQGRVYVTGDLTGAAGQRLGRIIRVDAATGAVDPTFNVGSTFAIVRALLVDSSDRLLVAGVLRGETVPAGFEFLTPGERIVRLLADGSVDPSFQAPLFGAAITLFSETTGGKILAWVPDPNTGEVLIRLNADGSRDSTFTEFGVASLRARPVTTADGKILLGGGFVGTPYRGIMRLNADGTVDSTFTLLGSTVLPGTPGVYTVGLQSDGKIILGGLSLRPGGTLASNSNIMRLNANGSVDTTFAVTVSPSGGSFTRNLLVLADDRIVAAGSSGTLVFRVLANGGLDSSFAPPAITVVNGFSYSDRLTRASSGAIVFATGAENQRGTIAGGGTVGSLLSFAADGSLSAGFVAPAIERESYGVTLTLQGSSQLVSGSFDRMGGTVATPVVRLNADGTRDQTFAALTSLPLWQTTTGLGTLGSGSLVASYTEEIVNFNQAQRLVRLDANGGVEASLSPSPALSVGSSLRVAPDGKLLVNRPAFDLGGALAGIQPLRRLLSNGSEDPTWQGPPASAFDMVWRDPNTQSPQQAFLGCYVLHAIYPEGRMLVFSSQPNAPSAFLVRLLPDGSGDPSFSPYAVETSPIAVSSQAFDPVTGQTVFVSVTRAGALPVEAVEVGPEGKIIVAGPLGFTSGNYNPQIVQLLPNGQVDSGFSVGTGATLANGLTAKIFRVRFAPDGKIWVLGNFDRFNGVTVSGLVRLNANGSLDATAVFPVGWVDYGAERADVGFELDGRVFLTGSFAQPGEKVPFSVTKIQGAPLTPIPTATPVPTPLPTPTPSPTPTPGGPTPTPTPTLTPTPTPTPTPVPARLINVSTRLVAGTGNSVPIAGFAVSAFPRTVIVRVLGPSLAAFGIANPLQNPTLELRDSGGNLIVSNDDWGTSADGSSGLIASMGLAPGNSAESAIIRTLQPGTYTAVVRGVGDTTGVCLVEVYERDASGGRLVNLSTRGLVGTDANVMIGGFVVGGTAPKRFLVRSLGPTLSQFGVPSVLGDPTIEVFAGQTVIGTNDDWQGGSQAAEITASGFAPPNALEPAIILTLGPGSYTAIVRGKNGTTGNALVEVYELP